MTSDEAAAAVIDALESLRVPYMLVGSFASNYYGVPRATQDIDLVVQARGETICAVAKELGPRFRLDPQISFETVTATSRLVLYVSQIPFEVEFFLLSDDAHDQQRFARRQRVVLLNRQTFLPTVEDMIITKLRWWMEARRTKDLDDARGMIAVQGSRIDWAYVDEWCDRHGTREILENLRNSTPTV